ncbi:MAG: hypothetical protein QNK92_16075 [Amylibacter sp.]
MANIAPLSIPRFLNVQNTIHRNPHHTYRRTFIRRHARIRRRRLDQSAFNPGTGHRSNNEFAKFFEKSRYFGAFYINPFGGQSFRVIDYGSLKAARETAENRCNTDASPAKFQLYAVSVPTGQDPKSDNIVGFSQGATIDFNADYLTHQNEGHFGAFAVSKGVSYGYTWDWNSQAEAEASTLLFCESDMLEDLAKVYIVEREFSVNAGYTSCKIAHSYSRN